MKLQEIDERAVKIYCDMDGVLANFQGGMTRYMQRLSGDPSFVYDDNRYEVDSKYRTLMWDSLKDYQKKLKGKAWYDLDPMHDAEELWKYISKYPTEILTATGNPIYKAQEQKELWIQDKAMFIDPATKINFTRKAAEKAQFASPISILIDDKEKAIIPWRGAGGIGILHTSAKSTINQLKALGL